MIIKNVKKPRSLFLAMALAASLVSMGEPAIAAPNSSTIPAYVMEVNTYTITAPIKSATDDMEEWITNSDAGLVGALDYSSSDIELGLEKPGSTPTQAQYIGLRFAELGIPKGATITNAYIQFTCDEVKNPSNPFSLSIWAENVDNAETFNNGNITTSVAPFEISTRWTNQKTTAVVNWAPANDSSTLWVAENDAGALQQTPELKELVQAIIDRSGWTSGNALSFFMTGNSGNRTVIAYEKNPAKAAVLHVTFTYSGNLEQAAPTGLSGVGPTSTGGSDGKISGTTTAMEYKLSTDTTYTTCGSSQTTGLAVGTYLVRYASAGGYNASPDVNVVIEEHIAPPVGLAGVAVSIAGASDGQITGTATTMEYKKSYSATWTTCTGTSITGLTAGLYNVRVAANGSLPASASVDVVVPAITKVAMSIFDDGINDATNSMGFTWYTVGASNNRSDVQIVADAGGTPDFTGATLVTGTCVATSTTSENESKYQEYLHKVLVTGLTADKKYYYRVGDSDLNLWSEVGSFTTAPLSGEFTFLDLADPQAKELDEAKLAADTFKAAVATVPDADFIAINGDIVDTGSKEYQWDWLFNNMSDVMLNYPITPIAGNHESQSGSFINHFNLSPAPGSATATGVYYSFDYSNAHFVMLNTNENSTTYSDFSVEQVNWMKADVAAAKAAGQWIIVVLHKGPYTTSNHASDGDIMGTTGVRTLIAPIFANLDVDLVLQGHDHIYARSKPINAAGKADTAVIKDISGGVEYHVNPDGVIYLIPSTAGPKVYYKNTSTALGADYYSLFDNSDESHSAIYGKDPTDSSRPVRSMVDNFEKITISGNKLTVVSYEIDHGALIDGSAGNDTPYIIDTFGIEKDGAYQAAPTGLTGVAPATVKSGGQITGVTTAMEYKAAAGTAWTACTDTTISNLASGTYCVRFAAKTGFAASSSTVVVVPAGITLTFGSETAGGAGYSRTISIDNYSGSLSGKYVVVQMISGSGINAKVSVVMISAIDASMTVSYQTAGTKIQAWLVSGLPNLVASNTGVSVYAYANI